MPMITPDRVVAACHAYHQQFGTEPRYLYVNWYDWDPLRYLLRDAIDEDAQVVALRREGRREPLPGLCHDEFERIECRGFRGHGSW